MVVRFLLIAAVLLTVSCSSIFESYYPALVEYQESGVDLVKELGGQKVASISMGYYAANANHSANLLAVVAGTEDGKGQVIFYNADNLSVLAKHSFEELKGQNGGLTPALALFGEDSAGVYTGAMGFPFPNLDNPYNGQLTMSITGSTDLRSFRATYTGVNSQLFMVTGTGSYSLSWGSAFTYQAVDPSSTSLSLPTTSFQPRLLDAIYAMGAVNSYYLIVSAGNEIYLFYDAALPPSNTTTIYPKAFYSNAGGWATATAAVIEEHADNASVLQAYSWSGGSPMASLRLSGDNQTKALAFDPFGNYWFLFQSSTGKLTRNKTWW